MTWLAPSMAWFGLLAPLVLLFWFLKIKRREIPISSTLLWSRVIEDKRVNSPLQRLRRSLVLLLQLLVIVCAVLALMEPERRGEEVSGRVHILLLDTSASMGVEEGGRTRFERARELALERVEAIGSNERGVVITFDHGARAVSPVTADRAVLARALRSLRPGVGRTRIGPAIELAVSIADQQREAVGVVLSDGRFEAWDGEGIPLPLDFVSIGREAANSGITALSARAELGVEGVLRVFAEVRNPGPDPAPGTLALRLGDNPVRVSRNEGIPPGERWSHSFELSTPSGTTPEARVLEVAWTPEGADALAADDAAWIVVEPPPVLRVWKVGPPNFVLEDALAVLPSTRLETLDAEAARERLEGDAEELPDVIVWDRVSPDALPEGPSHLLLGVLPPGVWEPEPERMTAPPVITWDREHPLNRFVSYSSLDGEIPEGWVLPDRPGSESLLDTRGGGLIRTFRAARSRGIVVGFDPVRTRWPLRTSFPFFLQGAVTFLGRSAEAAEGVRPGERIVFDGAEGIEEYRVTEPDGVISIVPATADGGFRSAELGKLGPYIIEWEDPDRRSEQGEPLRRKRIVPVSLLSLEESAIRPASVIDIAGTAVEERGSGGVISRRSFWPLLLALGVTLLMGEWFLYHRR